MSEASPTNEMTARVPDEDRAPNHEEAHHAAPRELPLHARHVARGARMTAHDGWLVPASYGDTRHEYDAVRVGGTTGRGAGIIDLSARGRIEVAGAEAVMFLNGMVTGDVARLEVGAWTPLAFPNVQGRLIAFARAFKTGAQEFLFDTEAATHQPVLKALQRFTLAGDFRVRDVTDELVCLSVQGAGANGVVDHVLGAEAAGVAPHHVGAFTHQDLALRVARATHTGEDGYHVFINRDSAADLLDRLVDAGARPVGYDALDVLRIEAGIPLHGADVTEANVVLEADQRDAVSFTKGCYVGQEIIARIHWRGHVAKRLAGVEFETAGAVAAGSTLSTTDGKEAGRVTSSAFSHALGKTIALAMIRYAHLTPGTELVTGTRRARVVELPFVRGGWHAFDPDAATEGATA